MGENKSDWPIWKRGKVGVTTPSKLAVPDLRAELEKAQQQIADLKRVEPVCCCGERWSNHTASDNHAFRDEMEYALECAKERIAKLTGSPDKPAADVCKLCHHVHTGKCMEDAPNPQFRCSCPGVCEHDRHPNYCFLCNWKEAPGVDEQSIYFCEFCGHIGKSSRHDGCSRLSYPIKREEK